MRAASIVLLSVWVAAFLQAQAPAPAAHPAPATPPAQARRRHKAVDGREARRRSGRRRP